METEPQFRYFRHSAQYALLADEGTVCAHCESAKTVLVLPPSYLFDDDYDEPESRLPQTFLCAKCLADGEFQDSENPIHIGDIDILWDAIKAEHPEMFAHEVGVEADERLAELAEATPPLRHDLPAPWPIHCADFCEYIGTVAQGNLEEFVKQEKLGSAPSPTETSGAFNAGKSVAVFECLTCHAVVGIGVP